MPPERRLIYALINRELRRGQINNTVTDRWPGEPPLLQPLRHQHHAAAVPRQQLHSVRALRAKNEHIASVWICDASHIHTYVSGANMWRRSPVERIFGDHEGPCRRIISCNLSLGLGGLHVCNGERVMLDLYY